MLKHSRLYLALQNFKGAQGNEAYLKEAFEQIAKAAFYTGYTGCFLINKGQDDQYKIKLTCIEFYYHEDNGGIKDPKKYLKGEEEFGYPLGALCHNPSGIDVLFDSPNKEYHASFLIRGYKAIQKGKPDYENNKKSRKWNTQDVWYDLMGGANMLDKGTFSIEWVDEESDEQNVVYTMERVNLEGQDRKYNRKWAYTKNPI